MNISPLLHNRRPDGELPSQEAAVLEHLEKLGIAYDLVCSEPADTMEKCALISEALGVSICKNLFLCNRQQTQFYLLAMPADKPFRTKDLSQQIGSARLSFAPENFLWDYLRCAPGSATVLGLLHDTEQHVRLLLDREVYESEYFGCHPCLCTCSLKLKTEDVLHRFLPSVGHEATVVTL